MLRLCLLLCFAAAQLVCAQDNSNSTDAGNSTADSLAQKVLTAGQLQQLGKVSGKVVSALIKQAPAAELANGDSDVATNGNCTVAREAFCLNVPPGEGRLARCLRVRIRNEDLGNVSGRRVAQKCRREVQAYYEDRGTNVNKNLQLANSCGADVDKYCSDVPAKPGAVLACLRKNVRKLRLKCKMQVVKAKIAAAQDYRADTQLAAACKKDAERVCSDVRNGSGRVQACLRSKRQEISWDCHAELFRQEVENADDIRMSVRLFNACRRDQQRFCADVEYGANRVKDCLEEHLTHQKFSKACKSEMQTMMQARARDFRLDPTLRTACSDDIDSLCGYVEDQIDGVESMQGNVINCLQDMYDDLKSGECKKAVHKAFERASRDYRLRTPLAEKCYDDTRNLCAAHTPGSARVISCLQDNREALQPECRTALFDLEVRMAEDIDFQYPLKSRCAAEIKQLCASVEHGHARMIQCLQEHLGAREMGSECRAEVRRSANRMAQDYRLNYRLKVACDKDTQNVCDGICYDDGQACGGTMLRCLTDNVDELESAECKKEVQYFIKMEVTDFRNDVMLAEACKQDVDSLCADVEPGEGRVLECLRMHRADLSPPCAQEELALSRQQSRDIRLRPKLMKLCGGEMVSFCKATKPGAGRMFTCLLEHIKKPAFGSTCRHEIEKREDRVKSDFRLDAGVSTQCADDIDAHCALEKQQAHGHAGVLTCLADKMVDPGIAIAEKCETQMSRAVRMAFWDFQANAALTAPCDDDVQQLCSTPAKGKSVYTIGVVGRCLTKQLAAGKPLSPQCRKLVSVAAPKDIRVSIQEWMNKDGTVKTSKVEAIMSKAREASSLITLNGPVAIISVMCAIGLSAWGFVWLYRRYAGHDKPYTLLVPKNEKQGRNGSTENSMDGSLDRK